MGPRMTSASDLRSERTALFSGGIRKGSCQGEIFATSVPGSVKAAARYSLGSGLSHTTVLRRSSSPIQSLLVAVAAGRSPVCVDAGPVFFASAERIHLSWKLQGWGRDGEWMICEELMSSCSKGEEKKKSRCVSAVQMRRAVPNIPKPVHKGHVNVHDHLQPADV